MIKLSKICLFQLTVVHPPVLPETLAGARPAHHQVTNHHYDHDVDFCHYHHYHHNDDIHDNHHHHYDHNDDIYDNHHHMIRSPTTEPKHLAVLASSPPVGNTLLLDRHKVQILL